MLKGAFQLNADPLTERCPAHLPSSSHDLDRAMIVAVARVGVVQVTIHQVVHVVSVRSSLMTAPRPMAVRGVMPGAGVLGRTPRGVLGILLDGTFVHVPRVVAVKVTLMEVVKMVIVLDGGMATPPGMSVGVLIVGLMAHRRPRQQGLVPYT